MPYQTTAETLRELFSTVGEVVEVRLRQERGFAFVEMADAVGMNKALRLNHTQMGARRINVEVTVGGGGNSAGRKEKLKKKKEKFSKLSEKQRQRSSDQASKKKSATDASAADAAAEPSDQ